MKKITIKSANETIYYDKLDNGLEIYMLPKKTVNNIYVTFNTKYGSMYNEFKDLEENKIIKVPNGIAHFLEHKMFEQENGIDPLIYYAHHGADVNASTTLRSTMYMFYGPDYLKENLEYLLDFVQKPYFTDENVEKEKGIIEQEIKMYDDDPYSVIDDGIRYNSFVKHYIRYPIGGSVKDIYSITKEQLYKCFNIFYHPSNMFLVVTGNFEPDEVLDIVKNNQDNKQFEPSKEIVMNKIKEPNKVYKDYEEKEMNVLISKLSIGIKVPISKIKLDPIKSYFYFSILFDSMFGTTSIFYEKMKELEYIDSSFDIGKNDIDTHTLITLGCDTKKPKELREEILKQISNINISEEDFERKRNLIIGSELYLYENIRLTNRYIANNIILYNNISNNVIELLKSLNKKELDDMIKLLDLSNISTFLIKPIEN